MTNIRLLRLGKALQRARQSAGLTQTDVIRATGISKATLTRLENGGSRPQSRTMDSLLGLYGPHGARLSALYEASDSDQPGWWEAFRDAIPAGFDSYISLEQSASSLRWYEPDLIPGLLQTERYARVVLGVASGDIERRVQLRLARQTHLLDSKASLSILLGESAVVRPMGDGDVMREQLHHLASLSERSHIDVRIVPFGRGMHVGLTTGGFTLLALAEDESPIVYMEGFTGAVILDDETESNRYSAAFGQLQALALNEEESRSIFLGNEE